jgi:Fe-S oxidoreductase
MRIIKGDPTPGLTYNPNETLYWDKQALKGELERVYEVCNLCRMCFNLCPSFPELFDAIDRNDSDVRKLTSAEHNRVLDTCYQCKLCYVKCPYTPDDKHPYLLDFPRLLLRAKAVRRNESGLGLRERILERPEMMGTMGGLTAGVSNWANRNPLMRAGLEAALGIHKDKLLPEFHSQRFDQWLNSRPKPAGDDSRAVLFATCYVNHYDPQIGKDTVEVFSKSGIALTCPRQNCCGMPALEAGDVDLAKRLVRQNVQSLVGHVEAGKKILAINPTCSYMLRKEYAELDGTEAAKQVAGATMDVSEYLFELNREGTFHRDFKSTPGRIGYHLPCHLKAQNIGYRSRDVMRLIPGSTVTLVDQCSAHDGTWAMKKEFFPLSLLAGKKAFDGMQATEAETMASDCPLASIQFEQGLGTGKRPLHPIQVLAKAYRVDGFPTPVPPPGETK